MIVRRLELADAPGYAAMHADPEILKYTGTTVWNAEEARSDLERMIQLYNEPEKNFIVWAVELRSENTLIGTCALVGDKECPEVGYRFVRVYWGQGYGKELVKGLIHYVEYQTHASRIKAFVMTENTASIKILESNGFELVREFFNDEVKALDREYVFTVSK